MDVSRLGVKSERQLPAYATAKGDLSGFCDLHRSSRQRGGGVGGAGGDGGGVFVCESLTH